MLTTRDVTTADIGEALCRVLRDGNDVHRCSAARALGRIGYAPALGPLIERLLDEDEDVRCDAAEALGRIGDERAGEALIRNLIEDPCGAVKLNAIEALGRLGNRSVIPQLRRLARARDESVTWDEEEFVGGGWDDWLDVQVESIEALVPRKFDDGEETVAQFWRRRFGAEFAGRVIDPLIGGLFAGRAEDLSMQAVFPTLIEMERRGGSIMRAALRRRRHGGSMPGRKLYSWRDGIGTLPQALSRHLGSNVHTGTTVRRISPGPGGFRVNLGDSGSLEARAVVIATQPHVAARLLENVDQLAADAAGLIDAPPVAVVLLGYRRAQVAHPLDGLGYLTPEAEGRALFGALFCSTMFPGRAPEGHVAIAGYLGGARAPELGRLTSADLIALAREEFQDLLGTTGHPAMARVRQWARGLPQYTLGHPGRVAALRGIEQRRPGLFLTGNYLEGPAVATCVAEAGRVAVRVDRFLAEGWTMGGRSEPSSEPQAIPA